MRRSFAEKLVCPFDKSELKLNVFSTDTENNIIEGLFTCSHCRRYYPVVYGLPIMSPDEYRQAQLELPLLMRWEKQIGGKLKEGFLLEEDNSIQEVE
jgi:uncharacterized protein YbaR (Trm112 family)